MVSEFYKRHSARLLLACLAALPFLALMGELVPSNNSIETWLPRNSEIRTQYDDFCHTFGADETILIAFQKPFPDADRIQALSGRLAGLDGLASCWSRQQVLETMLANDVSESTARERLVNLLATPTDSLETMLLSMNTHGIAHRKETLAEIQGQLDYCGMDHAILAGGPIVANQLNNLGSRRRAMVLFWLTLLICFLLLRWNVGCWKTSGALMLANVLCIELTLATIWIVGGEMNFIMSSLPVMVMVFTTAAAIHFIGHFAHEQRHADAVGRAMKAVIRPSAFATVTTVIGLISLAVSDIGPIPAFGAAAAVGTVYSFLIGILLTPAVLVTLKYQPSRQHASQEFLQGIGMYVLNRPWRVMFSGFAITAFARSVCFSFGR